MYNIMARYTRKLRRLRKGRKYKKSRKIRGGGLMDKFGKKPSTSAPAPKPVGPTYEPLTFLHITKTAGTAIEQLGEKYKNKQ